MQIKKTVIVVFLVMFWFSHALHAQLQHVTPGGGGYFEGSSASVSFTIGDVATSTLTGTSVMLTQGFQQPMLQVSTFSEEMDLAISLNAYPNPVSGILNLVSNEPLKAGRYELYSLTGSRIMEKELDGLVTKIDFQSQVSSTYFLKIIQDGKAVKTFKIVKR